MYECEESFESDFLKNNNTIPTPGSCFPEKPSETSEWRKAAKHCSKISLTWAVGGSIIQDFPNDIAYPLGRNASTSKYFYLEIHYDNPEIIKDIQNPDSPNTVFGYLKRALKARKDRGTGGCSILSCDNIQGNGDMTKTMLECFIKVNI